MNHYPDLARMIDLLACVLWEKAGKPEGGAEAFWAEAVRRVKTGAGTLSAKQEATSEVDADVARIRQDLKSLPQSVSRRQLTLPNRTTLAGSATARR